MDPFEEFEFKPLNKGLGFHKKPSDMESKSFDLSGTSQSHPVAPAGGAKRVEELNQIMNRIPSFDGPQMSGNKSQSKVEPALPRDSKNFPGPTYQAPRFRDTPEPQKGSQARSESKTEPLFQPQLPKIDILNSPTHLNRAGQRKEVPMHLGAFLFDALVVVGLFCLFTGVTLAITEADFAAVWNSAQTDLASGLSLILLAFSVIQFYLILSRSFFGATLGEWAFELSIGTKGQQKSALYPLQISWRSILLSLTGFVLLPLVGLLFGKDLVGRLSGVRLGRDI